MVTVGCPWVILEMVLPPRVDEVGVAVNCLLEYADDDDDVGDNCRGGRGSVDDWFKWGVVLEGGGGAAPGSCGQSVRVRLPSSINQT